MAWARKLPNGRYQGQYRDASNRTRSVGTFVRKGDAVVEAQEEESRIRRDEWIDPDLARTPFTEWSERWLDGHRHVLKPGTAATYKSLLRSRILPTFARKQLRAVKPSDVTAWIGEMVSEGLSPSRIRQSHVVLRLVFEAAVADGYLARNPALGAKLPRLAHVEAPYFSLDVVDALAGAMESPYEVLTGILGVPRAAMGRGGGTEAPTRRSPAPKVARPRLTRRGLRALRVRWNQEPRDPCGAAVPSDGDGDRDTPRGRQACPGRAAVHGPQGARPPALSVLLREAVATCARASRIAGGRCPRPAPLGRGAHRSRRGIAKDVAVGSRPPERRLQPDGVRASL
jgi:hypothetical protein